MMQNLLVGEYDPIWPEYFINEVKSIQQALSAIIVNTYHIGSTSVPNLASKPVIDILVEVTDLRLVDDYLPELQGLRLSYVKNDAWVGRKRFIRKRPHLPTELWIYETGDPEIKRLVRFSNLLKENKDYSLLYSRVKKKLADTVGGDLEAFDAGKSRFIQSMDIKAVNEQDVSGSIEIPRPVKIKWEKHLFNDAAIDNFNFYYSYLSRYSKSLEFLPFSDVLSIHSELARPRFNRIFSFNIHSDQIQERIKYLKMIYEGHKRPFSWWITPKDQPSTAVKPIHQHGITLAETHHMMRLQLKEYEEPLEKPLIFKLFNNQEDHPKLVHIFSGAPDNDRDLGKVLLSIAPGAIFLGKPLEVFTAYFDHQPVASACMVHYGKLVGIYDLFVNVNFRKRKIGSYMMHFLLNRANRLGYQFAVTCIPSSKLPFVESLGFKKHLEILEMVHQNKSK